MWRLIIVLILLIVLYMLVRKAFRELGGGAREAIGKDDMIQDPVCRAYVPKGAAVSSRIGGQTYFFCSARCAEAFQKQLSQLG